MATDDNVLHLGTLPDDIIRQIIRNDGISLKSVALVSHILVHLMNKNDCVYSIHNVYRSLNHGHFLCESIAINFRSCRIAFFMLKMAN